jgi:hypothetical protein
MYLIRDKENYEVYNAEFYSKDEALDALQELCYQEELDSEWFEIIKAR